MDLCRCVCILIYMDMSVCVCVCVCVWIYLFLWQIFVFSKGFDFLLDVLCWVWNNFILVKFNLFINNLTVKQFHSMVQLRLFWFTSFFYLVACWFLSSKIQLVLSTEIFAWSPKKILSFRAFPKDWKNGNYLVQGPVNMLEGVEQISLNPVLKFLLNVASCYHKEAYNFS